MTVTLTTAENALKQYYLDVVTDQLNLETNPLYNRFKKSERYVDGKQVVKLTRYGINGGIGAGTETGDLPAAQGNQYLQFTQSLKNLYGQIEISDKAILAAQRGTGAFVNLLNDEMDGLLRASKFNMSRMLYGDGSGVLTLCAANNAELNLEVADTCNLIEGMVVDIITAITDPACITGGEGRKIISVDAANKIITLDGTVPVTTIVTNAIIVHGSYGKELTGLGALFGTAELYGVDRNLYGFMKPYQKTNAGVISDLMLQEAIDTVEMRSGGKIDFMVCAPDVRRAYQKYLIGTGRQVQGMALEGGFNAISYNGIPVYADRFCPAGTLYLLDSGEFTLHQLCDWRWMEDGNGRILRQVPGTPKFNATLVKYVELMCEKPSAQAMISGITAPID